MIGPVDSGPDGATGRIVVGYVVDTAEGRAALRPGGDRGPAAAAPR